MFTVLCYIQKCNNQVTVISLFLPTFNQHLPLEVDRGEQNLLRITEIVICQVTNGTEHICREQRNGPYK